MYVCGTQCIPFRFSCPSCSPSRGDSRSARLRTVQSTACWILGGRCSSSSCARAPAAVGPYPPLPGFRRSALCGAFSQTFGHPSFDRSGSVARCQDGPVALEVQFQKAPRAPAICIRNILRMMHIPMFDRQIDKRQLQYHKVQNKLCTWITCGQLADLSCWNTSESLYSCVPRAWVLRKSRLRIRIWDRVYMWLQTSTPPAAGANIVRVFFVFSFSLNTFSLGSYQP